MANLNNIQLTDVRTQDADIAWIAWQYFRVLALVDTADKLVSINEFGEMSDFLVDQGREDEARALAHAVMFGRRYDHLDCDCTHLTDEEFKAKAAEGPLVHGVILTDLGREEMTLLEKNLTLIGSGSIPDFDDQATIIKHLVEKEEQLQESAAPAVELAAMLGIENPIVTQREELCEKLKTIENHLIDFGKE